MVLKQFALSRRNPGIVALCYIALGCFWIVLSSYLVSLETDDPELIRNFELFKGMAFISLSGLLIYLLLKAWNVPETTLSSVAIADLLEDFSPATKHPILPFILPFTLAPLVVLGVYLFKYPELENKTFTDLKAIAELKANKIRRWQEERFNDLKALSTDPSFIESVKLYHSGAKPALSRLKDRLGALREAYQYYSVMLIDSTGKTLINVSQANAPSIPPNIITSVLTSKKTSFYVWSNTPDGLILNMRLPIALQGSGQNTREQIFIITRINPDRFLGPLIGLWPDITVKGKALLVIDQSNNTLVFGADSSGYRMQSPDTGPAGNRVVAFARRMAATPRYQGDDESGATVYAASYPVAGSQWSIIAKQERSQVLLPFYHLLEWVALISFFGLMFVSSSLFIMWRQKQYRYELALIAEHSKTSRVMRHFYNRPFIGMAVTSTEKYWLEVNDYLCEMFGYRRDELMQMTWEEITHPEDRKKDKESFDRLRNGELDSYTLEKRFVRKDGSTIETELNVQCERNTEGEAELFLATIKDITDKKASDKKLKLASQVFQQSQEGIIITDDDSRITMVNKAFSRITGYDANEVLNRTIPELSSAENRARNKHLAIRESMDRDGRWEGEFISHRKDGAEYYAWLTITRFIDNETSFSGTIRTFSDITVRKEQERRVALLAHFDVLTQLPNRTLLMDRGHNAIRMAEQENKQVALLYCDLDQFKRVNDTLGHTAGDKLLVEIARRLEFVLHKEDTISRQGGDDFAVLLYDTGAQGAMRVAEKILSVTNKPVDLDAKIFNISFSIGIAVFPEDGRSFEALSKNADIAMYRAKEAGRNCFRFFTQEMQEAVNKQIQLEHGLSIAIEKNELELHYQPQVDLSRGNVVGMEALLRWNHPELGLISPAQFIPVAERSGQIIVIGEWVLETAVSQLKSLLAQGIGQIKVAVNLSARQLMQNDLAEKVMGILEKHHLEPYLLELELTESMLMENHQHVIKVLKQLSDYGIQLSIDDFGTGYSSLAYLKKLPVNTIKIDKSFVQDVTDDLDDAVIASSIIALGHSLGLKVVAEGVETEEQQHFLQTHQCDEAQGYLMSKPLSFSKLESLMGKGLQLLTTVTNPGEASRTVLVVDDEAEVGEAVHQVLVADGYQVFTVTNCKEALDIVASNQVGVIISDQCMPGMNGTEFLRKVKGLRPDSVRLILSHQEDIAGVDDAIRRGDVYKFMIKPWDPELMRSEVREAFQYRQMLLELKHLTRKHKT